MIRFTMPAAMLAFALVAPAAAEPVTPLDLLKTVTVSSPTLSPDGTSVAYVVKTMDLERDEVAGDIWLAAMDGSAQRQLTHRLGESEGTPKFSPDGALLGFLSSRGDGDDTPTRLWLLPMAGGEARALDTIDGSVSDYAFSPDGRHLALVVEDPEPKAEKDAKGDDRPRPRVIDRFWFKNDGVGFLDNRRNRIWLYDLQTGKAERLADGDFDEMFPAFSPDGRHLSFVSKRGDDPDRTTNTDIFLASVDSPGATPRQLTTYEGPDAEYFAPVWSPDGSRLAYVQSNDAWNVWYGPSALATVAIDGGSPTVLTAELDRNVESPVWTEDGGAIRVIVEDDGRFYLGEVDAGSGAVRQLVHGDYVLASPTAINGSRMALLKHSAFNPSEVYALSDGTLTKVTAHNDEWLEGLDFGTVEYTSFDSADGTEIRGFVYRPATSREGQPGATILNLHGGPASQFDFGWDSEILWQLAAGYVVIAPNPRGSTGRGEEFASASLKRWGDLDVQDVLAAVDDAVAKGIADPDRLGVSGWSYGGMLTNYVIASDQRFKAAVSGSSISNIITGFGHDMYTREYLAEFGTPWDNLEAWMAVSYPFFQNQRIVTPTLFIVGEEDVNVPAIASEQMYQALKVRGIDTRLVIYPGEYHSITRPSFFKDRIERWNGWFDTYLQD